MPVYTSTSKESLDQRPLITGTVSYLQSTGTQFIDTEFPITSENLKVEIVFKYDEFTDYGTIIGCQGEINFILRQYGGGLWLYPSGTRLRDITVNTKYTVTITLNNGSWTVTVSPGSGEDTTVADSFSGTYSGTIINNLNICLFNTTNLSNGSYGSQAIPSINAKATIYSCKIYQDDILGRDFSFLQASGDSLSPIIVYDKVTGKLFYNKGTGQFQYSGSEGFVHWFTPDVQSEYQPIDYLETSGTQYIDTKYYPTAETGIELDFMWLGSGTTAWVPICGIRGANSNFYCWFVNGTSLAVSPNYSTYDPGGGFTLTKNKRYKLYNRKGCTMFNKQVTHNTSLTIKTETKDTFHIGCISNNGSIDNRQPYMRIYGFQIFEKFAPVCDMRPCRRKSDGVLGLYDVLTGNFYTNQGTGEFIAGKVSRKKLIGVYKNNQRYSEIHDNTHRLYPVQEKYVHSETFPETLIGGSIFVAVDANGNPEFEGYSSSFSETEYDKTTRYTPDSETNSFVVAADQTADINYAYIRSLKYNGTPVEYWVGTYVNSAILGRGVGRATCTIYIPDTYKGKPVTRIAGGAFNSISPMRVQHFYVGNNAVIKGTNLSPAISFSCSVGLTVTDVNLYPIAHVYLGENVTENLVAISGVSTRVHFHFDKDHPIYCSDNELYPEMVFNKTKDTIYRYALYDQVIHIPYGIKIINAHDGGDETTTFIIPETVTEIVSLPAAKSTVTLVCECPENQTLILPNGFFAGSDKNKKTLTIYTDNLSLKNYAFSEYTTVTFYSLAEYVGE